MNQNRDPEKGWRGKRAGRGLTCSVAWRVPSAACAMTEWCKLPNVSVRLGSGPAVVAGLWWPDDDRPSGLLSNHWTRRVLAA